MKERQQQERFYELLKNKSLNQINLLGIGFILIFVLLFSTLVVYEEYQNFDREVASIKKEFLKEKKIFIKKDMARIDEYISRILNRKELNETNKKIEILSAIELLHNMHDEDGFIFVYERKNDLGNLKPSAMTKEHKRFIAMLSYGKKGFEEPALISWNSPLDTVDDRHLIYLKNIGLFEWSIGLVMHLHEMSQLISEKERSLRSKLIEVILKELTLALILFGAILAISKIVSSLIEREIKLFLDFFKEAANHSLIIDKELMHFKEFRVMSDYANQMVRTINARTNELKQLNLTLEDKVRQKTKNIAEKNSALIKANSMNEQILQNQDKFLKHSIHEINTPLTIILLHIDLLKIQHGKNRYLTKIEAGAKMIHTIYNDLSYMIKKSHQEYLPVYIDVSKFLQERIEFFGEIAHGNNLYFNSSIAPDISVFINETKLQRIIDNNLSNAIKYSKEGYPIYINLRKKSSRLTFSIATYSPQIKEISKIFNVYYRENAVKGGFGIGLNMVKEICEEEEIEIDVSSTPEQTRFTYHFKKGVS